ncbi:hypothetical protein PI124_g13554 [Phytophthora idaei]|nr:hypothetical protein PI125_g14373 [Phytophthora idaei]KAG3145837.1 hypothetical protein PI126_g13578 [Phytophthora idaei]KAG3241586.1 hypothetical protein PI124_g13554 [Phytophthora idaei]
MVVSTGHFASSHCKELLLAASCVLLRTLPGPLRSVATRLFATVLQVGWAYAGMSTSLPIVRTGSAVQEQPLLRKWWKMLEAVPATPMVVLKSREHKNT